MSPEELLEAARESADQARMARFSQLVLETRGTGRDRVAAHLAGQLADGHFVAAVMLEQVARQPGQGAA